MKKFSNSWLTAFIFASILACQPKTAETSAEATAEESTTAETAESEQRPSPLMVEEGQIAGKSIAVHYGAPSVKGRAIWGDLVPYNIVWRTGANEATYVEIPQDVNVEGQTLAAGKYSLFTIPKEKGPWTVIFNSDWELEHGHFQYDEKKDVLRVESSPVWEETSTEQLSIKIESPGLVIRWDKLKLPIVIQ
ncbi:DUF2911 domain-containing protein [Algoriphagus aestuariicola]|uniref:DUF2911 domain-containing protein n=1 Tax=Algoriphagus aestuariicola TaxID=1852016 RepID=A0ABS3BLJ9_9BACT|nr:DUF2911 domain-containing protein [Algoriphagus aestuariicola]MBN7799882.1 DUF2911 domain-containing protein [Algoriphagus aestuariicola]